MWIWKAYSETSYLFSCSLGKLILHPFGDDWTGLGPLIDLSGSNGPRVSGISRSAIVRNGEWKLPRGRHPIILFVHQCLPTEVPDPASITPYLLLWRNSLDSSPGTVLLCSYMDVSSSPSSSGLLD